MSAHLARGAIAAALIGSAWQSDTWPAVLRLSAAGAAMIALRGCPMCWTFGLVETVIRTIRRPA